MSHGASIVTNATKGAAKGALTQAEVWGKIGDTQKGLSGLSSYLDMLDKALRTHAPSTVMGAKFYSALHGIVLSACPDRAVACTAYVDITQIRQLRKD